MRENPSPKHKKFYGAIGDVNPIEHWGGVVYDQGSGPALLYFQSYDSEYGDDDDGMMVSVYNVFIEDDVIEELSYVDWDAVSQYVDVPVDDLKAYGRDPDPIVRAEVYAAVASYHGWSSFDDAEELTLKQAERKYGRMVDAAQRAQAKRYEQKLRREAKRDENPDDTSARKLKTRLLR